MTYHYGHSHRDGASDENSRESVPSSSGASSSTGNTGGLTFTGQTVVSAGGMGGGGIMGVNNNTPQFGGPPTDVSGGSSAPPNLTVAVGHNNTPSANVIGPQPVYQDSYVTFLNHPAGTA